MHDCKLNHQKCPKALVIGVEPRYLINFRGELIKAIRAKDVEVLTVSSPLTDDLKTDFLDKNIQHQAVPFKRNGLSPIADLKTLWVLLGLFKKVEPDFILAYTIKPVIWGGLAARFRRIRFIALITGLGFAFQGQSLKRKLLTRLVSFLYRIALKHATKVIFQNNDNLQVFVEHKIIPFEKTEVVNGSGVDITRFKFKPIEKPIEYISFLCIARLLGEKGLREYAAAAKEVKAKYPNMQFVLVGPNDTSPDGISLNEVQSWSEVDYLGSTQDVRPFVEKAHVYVLPSYHEGLPRSTIEAMAIGRPIITTDAVGCKETVEEGVNGFKVPVGDENALAEKMIWFIENPEKIETMGLVSRKMAEEKFDVDKVNARMLEIMGFS